ncbi:MAG: hypothetical protein ACTSVM_03860, partial [Candidatus Ranarchaeia archaeon]
MPASTKKNKSRNKQKKRAKKEAEINDALLPNVIQPQTLFEVGDFIRVQGTKQEVIDSGYLLSLAGEKCEYYSMRNHKISFTTIDKLTQKPAVGDRIIHIDKNGAIDDIGYLIETKKFMYTYYSIKYQSISTAIASEFEMDHISPSPRESELIQQALLAHHQIEELKKELARIEKEYEKRRQVLHQNMYSIFESAFQIIDQRGPHIDNTYGVVLSKLAACFRHAGKVSHISVKLPGYIRLTAEFNLICKPFQKNLIATIRFTTT